MGAIELLVGLLVCLNPPASPLSSLPPRMPPPRLSSTPCTSAPRTLHKSGDNASSGRSRTYVGQSSEPSPQASAPSYQLAGYLISSTRSLTHSDRRPSKSLPLSIGSTHTGNASIGFQLQSREHRAEINAFAMTHLAIKLKKLNGNFLGSTSCIAEDGN